MQLFNRCNSMERLNIFFYIYYCKYYRNNTPIAFKKKQIPVLPFRKIKSLRLTVYGWSEMSGMWTSVQYLYTERGAFMTTTKHVCAGKTSNSDASVVSAGGCRGRRAPFSAGFSRRWKGRSTVLIMLQNEHKHEHFFFFLRLLKEWQNIKKKKHSKLNCN